MRFRVWRSHPTEWRLFLTVWLVYLFHLAPLTGANENRYLDLVRSIIDEGRFEIDTYHYNTIDKSYVHGHYYAGAAPGPAFLAIPAYLLFRLVESVLPGTLFGQYDKATYIRGYLKGADAADAFVFSYPFGQFVVSHLVITGLTCSLFSVLTVVLLYRIVHELTQDRLKALVVGLAYAFGTTAFYYSTRLYPHVLGSFCIFFAFSLIAKRRMAGEGISRGRVFWAGLSLGASVLMDYAAAPAAGVVAVYTLLAVRDRRVGYGLLGAAITTGVLLVYHAVCFGGPFTTAYGFPNGPSDDGTHLYYTQNFHGFSFPPLNQVWGLSFGVFRGIFWYVPLSLLAVYALGRELMTSTRFRLEWGCVACVAVGQFVFNAMMHPNYWYGGWEFGPRFLTPMLPFLMLPFGAMVGTFRRELLIGLVGVSVLTNWIGVQYAPSNSLFGTVLLFFLSGPSTPLVLFVEKYIRTSTTWPVVVSPVGGFLFLGAMMWFIWSQRVFAVKEG